MLGFTFEKFKSRNDSGWKITANLGVVTLFLVSSTYMSLSLFAPNLFGSVQSTPAPIDQLAATTTTQAPVHANQEELNITAFALFFSLFVVATAYAGGFSPAQLEQEIKSVANNASALLCPRRALELPEHVIDERSLLLPVNNS